MSDIQTHWCGAPGPYGAHCTEDVGHRHSCYDAGDDVSFNERTMRDDEIPHGECDEEGCDAD
ncbi:hypothetical protein ACFWHR_07575 [Leucobacter sp. NPDC058333]|uniref:hypothetical protein n=1 Tax=Leucobacter sp. NPDC058333 TaxID=3346450 RepID=UPI0036680F41